MFRTLVVLGMVFVLTSQLNAQSVEYVKRKEREASEKYEKEHPNQHALPIGEPGNFHVGSVGYLEYGIHTEQIIDESNVIANITTEEHDEVHNCRMKKLVWVKTSTKDMVDGQSYNLGYCEITGTRTYATALGSKTLFVLEPKEAPQPKTAEHPDVWKWAQEGMAPLEERFLSYKNGKVTLEKVKTETVKNKNGSSTVKKNVIIPLKRLCAEDQEWILKRSDEK